MFYIGDWDKQKIISYYIENNDVKKVLIIYNKQRSEYTTGKETRYIELHHAKEHETHYDLLQYVNRYTLIVLDDLLISQQRYMNEYNCVANFINQTPAQTCFQLSSIHRRKRRFYDIARLLQQGEIKG